MSKKKENIFDLTQLINKSNDVEVKNINTTSDNSQLLQGYEIVPQAQWDKIPYRTHIRYLRTDGQMRKGGYINAVTHTIDKDGKDTIKFDMVSNFTPTAIKWPLYEGSVDKIWKRVDAPVAQQSTSAADLGEIKEDIVYCKKSIDLIKQEVQKISNELVRTINLIKKLHNIK